MDLDLGDLVDAGHQIGVEILFYGHTVFEMDIVLYSGSEGHDDASFHLGADDIGVDIPAAVHEGGDLVDLYLSVRLPGYLYHFAYDAAEAFGDGDAPSLVLSAMVPAGEVDKLVDECLVARVVEVLPAEFQRVFSSGVRHFIHKALIGEAVCRCIDGAPPHDGDG